MTIFRRLKERAERHFWEKHRKAPTLGAIANRIRSPTTKPLLKSTVANAHAEPAEPLNPEKPLKCTLQRQR